jgi:hypothetical protein
MAHFIAPSQHHTAIAGDSFASIATAKKVALERLKIVNTGKGAQGRLLNFESRLPAFGLEIGDRVGIPDAQQVWAIADYMAGEMNANAHGADARRMRRLMDDANSPCEAGDVYQVFQFYSCVRGKISKAELAMALWTYQVMQNGPWDHKPIIAKTFVRQGLSTQQDHIYLDKDFNEYAVFYDIWSNFHYGYVCLACGFDESTMLHGAGLEQIGSDLGRGNIPSINVTESGAASFDDPKDNAAIKAGFALWHKKSFGVTAQDLIDLMLGDKRFKRLRGTKNV